MIWAFVLVSLYNYVNFSMFNQYRYSMYTKSVYLVKSYIKLFKVKIYQGLGEKKQNESWRRLNGVVRIGSIIENSLSNP